MTKPEPVRYRTTNWKSYNESLRRRGSLLIWLDKDMAWLASQAGVLVVRRYSLMQRSSSA